MFWHAAVETVPCLSHPFWEAKLLFDRDGRINDLLERISKYHSDNPEIVSEWNMDAGDSARFTSIFLASSFFCSQTLSTPAPAPVMQTVRRPLFRKSSGDEI
jgi:hypothetical protein